MASSKDMTLTSVKVKADLFENFKIECVKRKFSFQKLADRSLYLYLTNEDFRKQINSQVDKGFKVGKLNNILYIQVMKDHGLLVEKYRPTNIDNYVGNESIKKSISNYISQNDIQNLIFYGPAGTGKTIIHANKDMEEGTMKISSMGLIEFKFSNDEVSSEYYMVRKAETDF